MAWAIGSMIVAITSFASAETDHAARADSVGLYGTWRWVGSEGGFVAIGGAALPVNCGCERLLTLRHDGTYEFVEQDSRNEYLLCNGRFIIHEGRGLVAEPGWPADFWLAFEDWWQGFEGRQLIRFEGVDTLLSYPGSADHGVSDALSHRFVRSAGRVSGRRALIRRPLSDRPVRFDRSDLPVDGEFVYYEEAPVLITCVDPVDPKRPRDPNRPPVVTLHVLVGKDGLVKKVKVGRGVTGYNDPAVDAVKNWTYYPALSNNKPVAVWIEVPVRFGP